jgi:hypothetical protein
VNVSVCTPLVLPTFTEPKLVPVNGLIDSTVKLWLTGVAAAYATPSPGWLAWIVHVPVVSSVTVAVAVEAVHTVGVVEVKLTCKSELAAAISATGADVLIAWFGIGLKVIVCGISVTVKLCETGVAGA